MRTIQVNPGSTHSKEVRIYIGAEDPTEQIPHSLDLTEEEAERLHNLLGATLQDLAGEQKGLEENND